MTPWMGHLLGCLKSSPPGLAVRIPQSIPVCTLYQRHRKQDAHAASSSPCWPATPPTLHRHLPLLQLPASVPPCANYTAIDPARCSSWNWVVLCHAAASCPADDGRQLLWGWLWIHHSHRQPLRLPSGPDSAAVWRRLPGTPGPGALHQQRTSCTGAAGALCLLALLRDRCRPLHPGAPVPHWHL